MLIKPLVMKHQYYTIIIITLQEQMIYWYCEVILIPFIAVYGA
jgi:hypothetical protein